jgi:Na+-transporting NADH:ubiquinone oxidoreductase subunit NqrB
MNVFNFDFQWIQFILQKVGSGVTPLALFQLVFNCVLKAEVNIGSFGLGLLYKLILTPAIIYLLYVVILNQNSKMIEVAIMESAMAPMITASILLLHMV